MIAARQVKHMLAAAEEKALLLGVPVNIAVLDAGAHLTAFIRMDGAVLGSIDLAIRKAKTAVLFATTSESVWDYCKPGAPAPTLELSNGGLAPFAGGIPVKGANGEVITPFNARMREKLKPSIRQIYAVGDSVVIFFDARGVATDGKPYVNTYAWFWDMRDGRVVRAHAFFDSIVFNDLWRRVVPAQAAAATTR